MTLTKAQSDELFGSPSMWDLYLIRQPKNISQMFQIFVEEPRVSKSIAQALDSLDKEKHAKVKQPTLCLLCDNNFLKMSPGIIVLMLPSLKQTNGAIFFLCHKCSDAEDDKVLERVQAKLRKSLNATFSIHWGSA